MSTYPDVITGIPIRTPLEVGYETLTAVTKFTDGKELRRLSTLLPRRTVTIKYEGVDSDDRDTLNNFFKARYGQFESFAFKYPIAGEFLNEYVDIADGIKTQYNLPCVGCKFTSTIYLNGEEAFPQPEITDAGGSDGRDLIDFLTVVPPAGTKITVSFDGTPMWTMRFNNNTLSYVMLMPNITSFDVELIEVPYETN